MEQNRCKEAVMNVPDMCIIILISADHAKASVQLSILQL